MVDRDDEETQEVSKSTSNGPKPPMISRVNVALVLGLVAITLLVLQPGILMMVIPVGGGAGWLALRDS